MSDPDARPIRKGKLRQPTEFGTVMQITEICENTKRGARGLILPASTQIGSPNESNLLPATGQRLDQFVIRPWTEIACHPGIVDDDFRSAYREPREAALVTLTDPAVRVALDALGLRLASFAEVG